MKTIEENNRMIAEFMGATGTDLLGNNIESKYHISWDWLMSVVNKISDLGFEFEIRAEETYFKDTSEYEIVASAFNGSVLINTYNAVVQFIEWYNENN